MKHEMNVNILLLKLKKLRWTLCSAVVVQFNVLHNMYVKTVVGS